MKKLVRNFVLGSLVITFFGAQTANAAQSFRVISRRSWGADDSLLFRTTASAPSSSTTSSSTSNISDATRKRINECNEAQENYPNDFKPKNTVSSFGGKNLRWPRRYSESVKQIVLHHTAMEVRNDGRSGKEKMQALYTYHADKLGWGDIGYNYVIDEDGNVYEGRSGGEFVVAGHAYCHNVGTIGIALMGNFEIEKPTHKQTVALRKLLDSLTNTYRINPTGTVVRHGKRVPTIVGHGDLLSTLCPGFMMQSVASTLRIMVKNKDFTSSIVFPSLPSKRRVSSTADRRSERMKNRGITTPVKELSPVDTTEFVGRPGGFVLTSIRFTALRKYNSRERIATVKRSNTRIGIWQGSGDNSVRVRNEIVIPNTINPGSSVSIPIRFQLPREEGVYTVDIGDSTYILKAEGRRARSERSATSFQTFSTQTRENTQTPGYRRAQAREILQRERSPSATNTPTGSTASAPTKGIRIRLEFDGRNLQISNNEGVFYLNKEGSQCVLRKAGSIVQSGIVRIGTSGSINTISNWGSSFNKFRGVLECQVLNGELTIINELSLENYMAGLAEEPDTEHFQKQRAFSIAARSYAAFYMNAKGTNRKFQSMPYDGSDSPASFQIYRGYVFEKQNPSWAKAVRDTANKIITKNGEIVKAAYFSSSDGRTRSPAENGWNNFPFAEVFVSKPDPWCSGLPLRGHGVGMSGCGASAQAEEGKTAEEILRYYYTGTKIASLQH